MLPSSFATGSGHLIPHARDSVDQESIGLAARHARNGFFGARNCYTCHADYGMFGTIVTKIGGMRHVWLYYTEFSGMPLEEARLKIRLRKPYPNSNCMECHSTHLQGWLASGEHRASLEEVRSGRMSCASAGCHGVAHPTTKPNAALPAQLAAARDGGAAPDGGLTTDAGASGERR